MHDAWRGGDNNFMDCDEKLLWKMWISFQWNEAKDIRSNDFRLPLWISNVCFRWALRSKHWFLVCNAVLLNRIDTSVPIILKSIFWSEAVRLTAVVIKFRSRSGCIELIKTRSRAVCVYQEIYTKFIIPDSNQHSWRREEETSQVSCMIKDAIVVPTDNQSIRISTMAFHCSWDANDDHVKHCCHQVSRRKEDACQR